MRYKDVILQYSLEYELDPYLVFAVIWVEADLTVPQRQGRQARALCELFRPLEAGPLKSWVLRNMTMTVCMTPILMLKLAVGI